MDVSFSDANSSWASLLIDEVHRSNILEDDDVFGYGSTNGTPYGKGKERSTSVDTSASRSRPHVDSKTLEQILQVLAQQGAALDSHRTELEHVRSEYSENLRNRDERIKANETLVHTLQAEKERANAELEALRLELSVHEASEADELNIEVVPIDEHERIIKRVKDDARARIELAEAEKSRFALQQKRYQIEIAQLRNQVDSRTYPEEVLHALTAQLQQAVVDSCHNVVEESEATKQALSEAQEKLSELEERVAEANEAEEEASKRCSALESEMADLTEERNLAFNEVQWHLEQSKLKLQDAEERDALHAQEQVEQLSIRTEELQIARDEALSETERLRAALDESEQSRETLLKKAMEREKDGLVEYENQVVELRKELELGQMDREQLRELLKTAEQEREIANTSLQESNKKLDAADNEREQLRTSCHSLATELQEAKTSLKDVSDRNEALQQDLERANAQLSEKLVELENLEKSHSASLVDKTSELADAAAKSQKLEEDLETLRRSAAADQDRIAQLTSELDESRDRESKLNQDLDAIRTIEGQLRAEILDLKADAEKVNEQVKDNEKRLLEMSEDLKKAKQATHVEQEQVSRLKATSEELSGRLKEVEASLNAVNGEKDALVKEFDLVSRIHETQVTELKEQKDKAESRLKDYELLLQNSSKDQAEVQNMLEEAARIKEIATKTEEAFIKAQQEMMQIRKEFTSLREEIVAKEKEVDQLQITLQEVRKGRTDALRENERIRLQYAESEGNRYEAIIQSEELEQQKSDLEQEKSSLEHELQNMRAQLAEVKSHLESAEQTQERLLEEKSQILTQLGKAESKCMKLEAARRQLAAVYGIPVDSPLASPDRPNPRKSASLSPSTSNATIQLAELPLPPAKRARTTRSSQNWPSVESVASSSSAHTVSLDDIDEPIAPLQKRTRATKSKKRDRGQPIAQPDINIPGSLFLLYESFAKAGSWQDDEGKPQCGFCSLEHASGSEPRLLEFDPLLYPAQFWSHCVYYHGIALRRDLESFLKAEARKDMTQAPIDDSTEVFTKLVSWKGENKTCVCGLCELESKINIRYARPKIQSDQFLAHCHTDHRLFWKPSS